MPLPPAKLTRSFELLSINLYEFIKNNNFQGLSLGLIRRPPPPPPCLSPAALPEPRRPA